MRISPEVEVSFSLATREAARRRHAHVTLEHLLYALLFDAETAAALRHAGGELAALQAKLEAYLDTEEERSVDETQPNVSVAFQRVTGRAAMHAQTRGKNDLRGTNLLVAMFAEHDSRAVACLNEHGVTRHDLINYLSHGISKVEESTQAEEPPAAEAPPESPSPPRTAQGLLLEAMFAHASHDAARRCHPSTSLAHILYSLLLTDEAAQLVRGAGADVAALRTSLERHLDTEIERSPGPSGAAAPLSARVLACLEHTAAAGKGGAASFGVTAMVIAISEETDSPAAKILREHGLTTLRDPVDAP